MVTVDFPGHELVGKKFDETYLVDDPRVYVVASGYARRNTGELVRYIGAENMVYVPGQIKVYTEDGIIKKITRTLTWEEKGAKKND